MTNQWWEIKVHSVPALEEMVFWRLEQFGCSGTASEIQSTRLVTRAYIPQVKIPELDLSTFFLDLRQDALAADLPEPVIESRLIDEEDWALSWKQHWHPMEIGDRFLINPAWLPPPEDCDRIILRLDPGSAFGTGTHATTQLCLESLEMRLGSPFQEKVIADIGCGSGILSIGAVLLGLPQVYAVDVDPLAVIATRSNLALNQIDPGRIVCEQGSVDELLAILPDGVDGMVCNILAEVIIQLMPKLTQLAKPNSWAILSGILLEQAPAIAEVLEQYGWDIATLWKQQEWCCFNVRRNGEG